MALRPRPSPLSAPFCISQSNSSTVFQIDASLQNVDLDFGTRKFPPDARIQARRGDPQLQLEMRAPWGFIALTAVTFASSSFVIDDVHIDGEVQTLSWSFEGIEPEFIYFFRKRLRCDLTQPGAAEQLLFGPRAWAIKSV